MTEKMRLKRRTALCLAGSVFLGTVGLPSMPIIAMESQSNYRDTMGHWASEAINRMSGYQIVNGYNGLFRPSDPITRGEMSIIIDRIMGYQKEADNIFVDLEEAFYTDAVLKAYEADILFDTNRLIRPKDNITREEVAFMVYHAFGIQPSQETLSFLDSDQVSPWAIESVSALASEGIIVGSEGKFAPKAPITRAEAVTILNRLLAGYYNTKGTYTDNINGSAVISAADANLKDVVIQGDLIIAEGVAEGDVILENVIVEGRTIIRGGGVHSIKVEGNSKLGDVTMAKEGSAVRLAVSGLAEVGNVIVDEKAADTVLEGKINHIKVEAKDANLTVQNANVESIEVVAEGVNVELKGKTDIKEVAVGKEAANSKISVEKTAKVNTVNAEAKATIEGQGVVSRVNANANDVIVQTDGTVVKAGEGTNGVIAGKEPVKGGSSSTTDKSDSSNSSGSSSSSDSSSNDDTIKQDLAISKVETVKNGLVRVTLNRASDKTLTKDQFSIICTSGGKNMTILGVRTENNRVYDLTTSYYDDNTYSLGIILEGGKLIEKEFVSKFDCPEITSAEAVRIDGTSAQFSFVSDTAGTIYYGLGEAMITRANFTEEPTAEELMENGIKMDMKYQYNEILLNSLVENTPYTLYYVAVDLDNKVTPVKNIQIGAEPAKAPEQGEFSIVSAKGFALQATDFFDEMGGFEIVLNQATEEPLKVEDFEITCPRDGKLTLGRLETEDNKTYKLYMKKGYNFVSGNTYTANIKFKDGTIADKKFFVDVWVDDITALKVEATTSGVIQVSFNAKEAGKIYYDVTAEDQQNSTPKDPTELFEKGQVREITSGYNVLEGIAAKEGEWFRYTLEDEIGNKMNRYGYIKVPAYVPEVDQPDADVIEITDIQFVEEDDYYGYPQITVTFNKPINPGSFGGKDIAVTGINGRLSWIIEWKGGGMEESDTVYMSIMNYKYVEILSGEHQLVITLSLESNAGNWVQQKVKGTFTTP